MKNDIETRKKLVEMCTKVAEINCILSATGATIGAIGNNSLETIGLISLGVNLGFLSYDVYQLYQLDKEEYNNEKSHLKKLIKTNNL